MAVGMGVVFGFLLLLVAMVVALSAGARRFGPAPDEAGEAPRAGARRAAAVAAAAHHRRRARSPEG